MIDTIRKNYTGFPAVMDLYFPRMSATSKAALMAMLNGVAVKEVSSIFSLSTQALYKMRAKYFKSQKQLTELLKVMEGA